MNKIHSFNCIHSFMIKLVLMVFKMNYENKKVGFLGPEGSFSEKAASKLNANLIPIDSIIKVFDLVDSGELFAGVVPIENSIEGPVSITLDLLANEYDLKIKGEIVLPIKHNLLVNRDAYISDIKIIYSHEQAISQCRNFLKNFDFEIETVKSTSMASKMVLKDNSYGAISSDAAASFYNLKVLKSNIQDYPRNKTRFIIISKEDSKKLNNNYKTSIVLSIKEDKVGALYEILSEFNKRNINLTKIESRPIKTELGSYIFFIDFNGHRTDETIKSLFKSINEYVSILKILGSYSILE